MPKRPREEEAGEGGRGEKHHKRARHSERDDGSHHRDESAAAAGAGAGGSASADDDGKSGSRYTLFVGNVPFTCPRDALMKHFACVGSDNILQLRMLSRKKEEKVMVDGGVQHKGCGFIEFKTEGALKKALGLHHTFVRGYEGRKINVELTAGGGGNSKDRKEKIKAKNEALNEERKKRHDRVERERAEEAAKAAEEAEAKRAEAEERKKEKKAKAENRPKQEKEDRSATEAAAPAAGGGAGAWPRKGNTAK